MKKNKLFYKTATLLLLAGLFYSCDLIFKSHDVLIDQETKDYCLFGKDSYWIYQDSATLKTNNIVLETPTVHEFISFGGGDNCYNGETFSTNISSYLQDSIFSFRVILTATFANPDIVRPCVLLLQSENSPRWAGEPYYSNGEIDEFFFNANNIDVNNMTLFDKKDSASINGVTYSNVKIFEFNYLEKKRIYYWAKYIGLIREEIYENDNVIVKNLIRYNVKPYKQ